VTTGYIHEWTVYRKLRNQLLFVLVAYVPLAVTLFIVLPVSKFDSAFRLVNVTWLVFFRPHSLSSAQLAVPTVRTAVFLTFRTARFKFFD
jgi:hypothetical protein